MTREDIEKAAVEFANDKCQKRGCSKTYRLHLDFDRYDIEQSFETGAEWYINSVWHDRTEQADTSKELMLMYSNRSCRITQLNLTWDGFLSVDMFIKWAYIEDLIPNTEE